MIRQTHRAFAVAAAQPHHAYEPLRDRLVAGVQAAVPSAVLRGDPVDRLPGNAHFTFPGCEGDSLLFLLDAAGVAVSTVRLTADLQRSRERLVTAREEERRRLRRDLHDGLGAQLAGLTVQTGVLRSLIRRDPAAADELAAELRGELRTAIALLSGRSLRAREVAWRSAMVGSMVALEAAAREASAIVRAAGGAPGAGTHASDVTHELVANALLDAPAFPTPSLDPSDASP